MSETKKAPVAPPRLETNQSPEIEADSKFTALHGRIALSLKTGDNTIFDPSKTDIGEVKVDNLASTNITEQHFDAADNASTRERIDATQKIIEELRQTDDEVKQWDLNKLTAEQRKKLDEKIFNHWLNNDKNGVVKIFQSGYGKSAGDQFICKVFNVETLKQINEQKVREFYNRFCTKNNEGKTNTGAFVAKVIEIFNGDFDKIRQNRNVIQWVSNVFGVDYAKLEVSLHYTLVQEKLEPGKIGGFVEQINAKPEGTDKPRIDQLTDPEKPVCEYLFQKGGPLELKPVTTTSTSNETQQPFEKDKTYKLSEMFSLVKGDPLDPAKESEKTYYDKYFIADPPEKIELTGEQKQKLEKVEPILTKKNGETILNPNILSFYNELQTQSRYTNGRIISESDLFGLSAASSSTPEKQAELYRAITDAILSIHENSFNTPTQRPLIYRFFDKQTEKIDNELIPLQFYVDSDYVIDENGNPKELRPENERLLLYDKDGNPINEPQRITNFWRQRINELRKAISEENKLKSYHLRWIEFLSHSVDVAGLLKIIKEKQEASNKPPPPPETTEVASFDEIINVAKNLEKNKPVTLTMTSEGLATLLPAFLPAIKKLIQDKHPRVNPVLTLVQKPNKILIENKKASTSITVHAKAPGFDKNIELKFTLDNTSSENELKFSEITVDPGKIMFLIDLQGEVRTALSALTVNQILKDALQEQLATVKSDIVIDKIDMSFTSDNKLQITLAGQKKEPQKTA